MKIEQIFSKKLTRNINGVVKAEEVDNDSVFVELDEYVVTNELDKHFRAFFESYVPAVSNRQAGMSGNIGVWVSGFFGSGKSHFIKILSYLLENREVEKDGKTFKAIDFFKEKITDAMLYADIQSVVNKNTDVILFNIDSRANTDDQENAILKVFLKVFNERVGYCADFPHIAHLERELDKKDQYQKFKEKFAELTKKPWDEERDAYDFYRDEMSEALAFASGQTPESARQWVEDLKNNFPLDIHNFCKWVNEYLDASEDKNIIFLVDEVGQFIGKNTQMMLKLQTITEDLGTHCGGRAWVIVTSQADIDAAVGGMDKRDGQDFSKIQGRFTTRLQLSSSNTSEVIQKRLLEKTEEAKEKLLQTFAEKGDILRNQLSFDKTTTAELKPYTDAPSFVDNYPFVPYHYLLVQKVFESIRTKGATGKHLAMGERSLLDAFQSAAKQIKDSQLDVLIPFSSFYAPIDSFLEPAVKRTIDQACDKESLSDNDGTLLKTLFLIRYVDVVKSTLDNLVTLSIESIDADKIKLKKQIEESLNRLEREGLIARNADEYIFLTNEEREIENEIRQTDVEPSEVSNKLSSIIFDSVLQRKRLYRYSVNKQDFSVSRFCNGHPKDGSTLDDLVVKVVSPLDSHFEKYNTEQYCLNTTTDGDGHILVKLDDQQRLWNELDTLIKTDRFLKQNSGQRPEHEHLLRDKQMENVTREKRLTQEFESLFAEAEVFALGAKLPKKSSTPSTIMDEAYKYVIENTFAKLNMLRPTSGEVLKELQHVLMADDLAQIGLDLDAQECNPEAMKEVGQYIALKEERNEAVYLQDIVKRFTRRPYGWHDNEVLLLVARLGLAGKINLRYQSTELSLKKSYDLFNSVRKRGDVRVQKTRQHDEHQIKKATKLVKTIFSKTYTGSGEKELHQLIRQQLGSWKDELKSFDNKSQTGQFPGKEQIAEGLVLVSGLLDQSNSFALIERFVNDAKILEDFVERFEDLDDFYNSQFQTWQQLVKALEVQFKANRATLEKNEEASKAIDELERIYNMDEPYSLLRNISGLIEQVQKIDKELINERRKLAITQVESRIKTITTGLKESTAPSELQNKVLRPLQLCKQTIETTTSIPEIKSQQSEAESCEDDAWDEINTYIKENTYKSATTSPKDETVATTETNETLNYPKRTVTVNTAKLASGSFIETEQQADEYLEKIREELMKAIKSGGRVRIK